MWVACIGRGVMKDKPLPPLRYLQSRRISRLAYKVQERATDTVKYMRTVVRNRGA